MAQITIYRAAACLALTAMIWTAGEAAAAQAPAAAQADGVTLKQTIDSVVAYNPTIKAFQEYRQAAEFDLKRARSGWFPRVDARAGYGFEQWSDANTRNPDYAQNSRD